MLVSQVPTSAAAGVQLRMLLVCQAGEVTSGVQGTVPERRRKNAYWVVAGFPPLAWAVQVRVVPYVAEAGLGVLVSVSGVGAAVSVTVAVSCLVVSAWLVAMTVTVVTLPSVAGAEYTA